MKNLFKFLAIWIACYTPILLAGDDVVPVVIASDSNGVIVHLKEKYGNEVIDTCTVVSIYQRCWVLTKKNRQSAYYPVDNYNMIPSDKTK